MVAPSTLLIGLCRLVPVLNQTNRASIIASPAGPCVMGMLRQVREDREETGRWVDDWAVAGAWKISFSSRRRDLPSLSWFSRRLSAHFRHSRIGDGDRLHGSQREDVDCGSHFGVSPSTRNAAACRTPSDLQLPSQAIAPPIREHGSPRRSSRSGSSAGDEYRP